MKGNTCNVQSIEGIGSDDYIDSHLTCLLEKYSWVNQPPDGYFVYAGHLLNVAISAYCPDNKNRSTATCSAAQSSANFL